MPGQIFRSCVGTRFRISGAPRHVSAQSCCAVPVLPSRSVRGVPMSLRHKIRPWNTGSAREHSAISGKRTGVGRPQRTLQTLGRDIEREPVPQPTIDCGSAAVVMTSSCQPAGPRRHDPELARRSAPKSFCGDSEDPLDNATEESQLGLIHDGDKSQRVT